MNYAKKKTCFRRDLIDIEPGTWMPEHEHYLIIVSIVKIGF